MANRITQNMMSHNYLYSLNKNALRQDQYNAQLHSGKIVSKGSDNPVVTVRSLRFQSTLGQNEQYTTNLKDAMSWMETTDAAMSDVGTIMTNMQERMTYASSTGSLNADDLETIAHEMDNMLNELVSIGNTQLGDRYVFSGQRDKTQPYSRDPVTGEISYSGDMNKISMVVQVGSTTTPEQDSVNVTGQDVFGEGGVAFLNQFNEIYKQLKAGNNEWVSKEGIQIMQDAHAHMLKAHTRLGTRMASYETSLNVMEKNNTIITNDLANNEDTDMAKAIMNLKVAESVYKASLSVGAKILPPSLVDYLN